MRRRTRAGVVLVLACMALTACEVDFAPDDDTHSWLALGDSYSSGEGLPDAVDAPGTHRCQRSPSAYASLAAAAVAVTPRFDPVTMLACTGATIAPNSGSSPEYDDADWDGQLAELSVNDRFDVITLTFGGNDLRFGQTLDACIRRMVDAYGRAFRIGGFEWLTVRLHSGFCEIDKATALKAIADLRLTLTEHYVKTAAHLEGDGVLYVLGYPRLFAPSDVWPLNEALLGICSGIKPDDADMLGGLVNALNKTTKDAAASANALVKATGRSVKFVPVDDLYATHELCGTATPWINGFPTFDLEDRGDFLHRLNSSFHPNADGHRAVADRIAGRVEAELGTAK